MTQQQWYYLASGREGGPVSSATLRQLAAAGQLTPTDQVWQAGMTRKIAAASIKGLFPRIVPMLDAPVMPVVESPSAVASMPIVKAQPIAATPMTGTVDAEAVDAEVVEEAGTTGTTTPRGDALATARNVAESTHKMLDGVGGQAKTMFDSLSKKLSEVKPSQFSLPKMGSSAAPVSSAAPAVAAAPLPRQLPRDLTEADIVAEVAVTYQGGHPQSLQQCTGTLFLSRTHCDFQTSVAGGEISIPYANVGEILEPRRGSHPRAMVKRAETAKLAATSGKVLASVAGAMIGGIGGQAVRAVGAGAASSVGGLGPVPNNRLVVVLLDGAAKHKLLFDTEGLDAATAAAAATQFWMQAAAVRPLFARRPAVKPNAAPKPNVAPSRPAPAQTPSAGTLAVAAATNTTATGLYVRTASGAIAGPLNPQQLSAGIARGEFSPIDQIKIELWLPLQTLQLASLLGGGEILSALPGNVLPPADDASTDVGPLPPNDNSGYPVSISSSPSPRRSSALPVAAAGIAAGVVGLAAGAALASSRSRSAASTAGSFVAFDRNGDGVADIVGRDSNGDGRIDQVGVDTDYDGDLDAIGVDRNHDGNVDAVAFDSDNDGHLDTVAADLDYDGDADAAGYDADDDGDLDEVYVDDDFDAGDFGDE